jgi:predicted TIM-barrel fold metal-dependent hydrolase
MTAYRIFDNHQHVGGVPGVPGQRFSGVLDDAQREEDFQRRVAVMDRAGIAQAAVMPAHSYPRPNGLADTRAVNDALAAYCARDPARFPAVIGTVEPRYGDDGLVEIDRMGALGFKGVSWHHRQQGLPIDHPVMFRIIERMARHNLVPFVHCLADADFEDVWRLCTLAQAFPRTPFLCMDTATDAVNFENAMRCGERAPNMYFDITSFMLQPDAISRFVSRLGAARLIFGSNLYSMMRTHRMREIEAVTAARLPDTARRQILGDNARRILELA